MGKIVNIHDFQEQNNPSPSEETEESSVTEQKELSPLLTKFFNLPDGLFRVALQQILVALASVIAGLIVLIWFRSPQAFFPFLLGAWMVWLAFSIVFDYDAGKIIEMPLICVSVRQGIKLQNRTRVTFRDNQEVPTYYSYFIPGRRVNMFAPNYVYIIYVRESNPNLMIGFQPL